MPSMYFLHFLQYIIEDTRTPYNALSICKQRIFCPRLYQTYLSHTPTKISRSTSINCPLIFIIILSSPNAIYGCANSFGVSSAITSLFCFVSITPVVMIDSDAAVRLVASSREICACCVLPFAHILDLMVSSLFLLNKIRLFIAIFLSRFFILLTLIGSKKTRSWSC